MTVVLNIEPDPGAMRLMSWILQGEGYDVLGLPIVEDAASRHPDVIIVDTDMAQTEKRAYIGALRQAVPAVQILDLGVGVERSAYDTGADQYLDKPFDADDLIARVSRCCRPGS